MTSNRCASWRAGRRSARRISLRRSTPIAFAAARIPTRRCRRRNRPARIRPTARSSTTRSRQRRNRVVLSFFDTDGPARSAGIRATTRRPRRFPISTSRPIGSGPSCGRRPLPDSTASSGICAKRRRARSRRICRSRRCRTIRRAFRRGRSSLPAATSCVSRLTVICWKQRLDVLMDPRVSISPRSAGEQYALARRL